MYIQYLHCIHPRTPFPCHFPASTGTKSHLDRTCSVLLFSDFVEEKGKKKTKKWLLLVSDKDRHKDFPCDISMYMCIITPIGSSPLFFFKLP
jgi:hypothetical protein